MKKCKRHLLDCAQRAPHTPQTCSLSTYSTLCGSSRCCAWSQDPDIELPDLERELGVHLHRDLDNYLNAPNTEESAAVLKSLPQRLRVERGSAAAAGAGAAPQFSTALVTHVALKAAVFSLQVRRTDSVQMCTLQARQEQGAAVVLLASCTRLGQFTAQLQPCIVLKQLVQSGLASDS